MDFLSAITESGVFMADQNGKLTRAELTAKAELDAKALLQKYDRESNFREEIGVWAWAVTFLGVSLTVFHIYTGYFGTFPSQKQGAVHLGTALGLIFILFPFKKGQQLFRKPYLGTTSYWPFWPCT